MVCYYWHMPRLRAAAIVLRDQHLLVLYREHDGRQYYVFPGGGIEPVESAENAVVREVLEETSIQVKADRLVYELYHDNGDIHYYYLCEYVSGTPALQTDTNEHQATLEGDIHVPLWLALSRVRKEPVYPAEITERLLSDVAKGFQDGTVGMRA